MTTEKNSAIIQSVENIGASPSGKATDSDSVITGVRIPVPQPKKEWEEHRSSHSFFALCFTMRTPSQLGCDCFALLALSASWALVQNMVQNPCAPAKKHREPCSRYFFIQAAGLVYHRRTKCGAYHQGRVAPLHLITRQRVSSCGLMIYRNKLRMIYKASPWFIYESAI